jgi:aryl-alcohol dehydrogenase-like predicted oxidoreductase
LGRTGFAATRIGIGDVADRSVPIEQCVATVRRALDAGLNLLDSAPSYEDGYSEQIVGLAVRQFCGGSAGSRDRVFVIDKVDHLDQPVAPQVDGSLGRLALDYTDCFLFHGVSKVQDWRKLIEPGGGMDQLRACQRAGKTRFVGISSHHPDVLVEAIGADACDVVMFAIGPFCHERYLSEILPMTRARNVGTVCFKTFGAGKLVADTEGYGRPIQARPRGKFSSGPAGAAAAGSKSALPKMDVADCVQYTLSCDPDVALLGMSFAAEQDAALSVAAAFTVALSADRMAAIRARAAECIKDKGRVWWNPPG